MNIRVNDLVVIKVDSTGRVWKVKSITPDGQLLMHLPNRIEVTCAPDKVCDLDEMVINLVQAMINSGEAKIISWG